MDSPVTGHIVKGPEDLRAQIEAQASVKNQPTFFHLHAQLPRQGRTDTPMAATDRMWVVLKTYASDGENELHAHPNEDHVFLVLQGEADFYGPKGELKRVKQHDGILLPRGTFYWFRAIGEEPLVMARIGAVVDAAKDALSRIDSGGKPMAGNSAANKFVPAILSDRWFD
jgi:mannose-6-phosphate isomerase-like protein (cupin superfamily)